MIKRKLPWKLFALFALPLVVSCNPSTGKVKQTDESLQIYPDYTSVAIPPNIAPMNFMVRNNGRAFIAEISNSQNRRIIIRDRKGIIQIPIHKWRKLLEEDKGGILTISVFRKTRGNQWERFAAVKNEIAKEKIDPYIAFRKIPASNILWNIMGIYQRCLENFKQYPIMVNTLTEKNCMNCHSFNAGDPEQMVFHMRAVHAGTFVMNRDNIQFVDTKSDHTRSAGVYPSWHPNGELIAFSANMINQGFHARMGKIDFVVDKYSDIVLYDVKANSITRPAALASEKLENLPSWSIDGTKLYYISADKIADSLSYELILYNLMSIGFDERTRKFGDSDTLINAKHFGKSISFPRESPTHAIISFIGLNYGYFSIYNNEADVYFYNTETKEITRPPVNSEFTESYPSWSTNGSWLMFVSKRDDGILSEVWFSHIDKNGNAGKPFVMPQRHPDFYEHYLYNYNRPEFITGKVRMNPRKVYAYVKKGAVPSVFNEAESLDISSGATILTGKTEDVFYHHN